MSRVVGWDDFAGFYGAQRAAWLLTPCAYGVNSLAAKADGAGWHRLSRCINALEYFVKPIDSVIQAVAAPIFSVINFCVMVHHERLSNNRCKWIALALASPLLLPAWTLYQTMSLWCKICGDVAANIVIPRKLIYPFKDQPVVETKLNDSIRYDVVHTMKRHQIFFEARRIIRQSHCDDLLLNSLFMRQKIEMVQWQFDQLYSKQDKEARQLADQLDQQQEAI